MDNENKVNFLEGKFNKLSVSIKHSHQKKYFHLHTVRNFIYHFEKIMNKDAQTWIFKNLDDYIDNCENYIDTMDRDISKELYMEYLDKIGDYYRANLNFTLYTSFDILLVLVAALFVLFKLFFTWINSIALIIPCFLVYFFYLMYKRKINKTFGFFH